MTRNRVAVAIAAAVAVVVGFGAHAARADAGKGGVDAKAAFERLKGMEGTWTGEFPDESGTVQKVIHEFRTSAAGSVVMETMNPDTEHEMINMYHLDGDELVVTHYCSGGNQPEMKLDRAHAGPNELPFDFTGGSNLDPAKDHYIRDLRLVFHDDGRVDSIWRSWADGKEEGTMVFTLSRAGG